MIQKIDSFYTYEHYMYVCLVWEDYLVPRRCGFRKPKSYNYVYRRFENTALSNNSIWYWEVQFSGIHIDITIDMIWFYTLQGIEQPNQIVIISWTSWAHVMYVDYKKLRILRTFLRYVLNLLWFILSMLFH